MKGVNKFREVIKTQGGLCVSEYEKRSHWRVLSRVMDLTLVLLEHTQGEQLGGYYKNLYIGDGDLEQDGVGRS